MIQRRPSARSVAQIFGAPIAIAIVSLAGLVSALLGDGVPDLISWIALAVPVAVVGWAWRARRT